MGQEAYTYRYTAADRAAEKRQIANERSYLNHIRGGNYAQEGNDFFKSYDAHTQGWNNVFTGRYNNKVMTDRNNKQKAANARMAERNRQMDARNRQQEARNKVIESRNNKVAGRNDIYKRGMGAGLDIGNGSKALRAPTKTNKTISTGIQSKADKLTTSLGIGRSGLGI
jgi:hypothetical protein